MLHVQAKLPSVLLQAAFPSQSFVPFMHSSMSVQTQE